MTDLSSPLFVNVLLCSIYLLTVAAVGLTVWSTVRAVRLRGQGGQYENGIPARRIAWGTAILVVVLLAVTFAFGREDPIIINGREYDEAFWLRTSDMLINSSLALIVIAIGGIVLCRSCRKLLKFL